MLSIQEFQIQWRHTGHDGILNHQPHHCLPNRLFGRRSKKTSTLRVTGLYVGNSPEDGEFTALMSSNAENVSIWCHAVYKHTFLSDCQEIITLWIIIISKHTGDPLHSRALAHSRAPLFTQPCPHCSHSRAPGEQWARLCLFTLQGCVQADRLCRGSPVRVFFCSDITRK